MSYRVLAAAGLLAAGLLLVLGGCRGTAPPLPGLPPPDAVPDADDLGEAIEESAGAERDSFLVGRLRTGGLTPVFGGRFRLASGAVAAFVPGRHPLRGQELVVAAAEGGTPAAAALLEEARLLSARAAYTAAPERTVLVAFLPVGAGPQGLAAVLDAPVWTREQTAAALVLGASVNGPGYERVAEARGVPLQLLPAPDLAQPAQGTVVAAALARALRQALHTAANGAPAFPDVQALPDTARSRP